jgi:hypothetical protein
MKAYEFDENGKAKEIEIPTKAAMWWTKPRANG